VQRSKPVVLKFFSYSPLQMQTRALPIPPLAKSQKRQLQKYHTTWIWF